MEYYKKINLFPFLGMLVGIFIGLSYIIFNLNIINYLASPIGRFKGFPLLLGIPLLTGMYGILLGKLIEIYLKKTGKNKKLWT